jgi:hypothetical protein
VHPAATIGVSNDGATLNVLDDNNGIVLSPNVPENDFSTYQVQLDADLAQGGIGAFGSSPTYSWSLSSAPDSSSVSGSSTYRLNFTWASFTGAARTDTVVITVTDGSNSVSETIVFHVASTTSAGYNATQPTTTASFAGFLPPDAVSANQATGGFRPILGGSHGR